MGWIERWSRRRFLAVTGATAADVTTSLSTLGQTAASTQQQNAREAASSMPPAGVITGGVQPLMKGMTARPLRYQPVSGEFVIRNGPEFFNRPLYGPNNGFRVDAGDKPEFSLYLPGHGGNLKLGFVDTARSTSKWAADADEVIARYRPGRMIYEIRDALLGSGTLHVELLTTGAGSGLLVKAEGPACLQGPAWHGALQV